MYDMIRSITGTGTGKGPIIALHDAFSGNLSNWAGVLSGADRMVLDSHPYLAFTDTNDDPWSEQIGKPCTQWATMFNTSGTAFGPTFAGEWSVGINDCGQFLNGVNNGTRYEGEYPAPANVRFGSCDSFTDSSQWNDAYKAQVRDFALAQMDSFQNWFFWTWKIGNSTVYNRVAVRTGFSSITLLAIQADNGKFVDVFRARLGRTLMVYRKAICLLIREHM